MDIVDSGPEVAISIPIDTEKDHIDGAEVEHRREGIFLSKNC